MRGAIIILRAETHVHPGVGQSTGALDLPVARERTTDFPFIPGSGVKGAFRVWAKEQAGMKETINENGQTREVENEDLKRLFGNVGENTGDVDGAGQLLFSDARLLLLPVRCVTDSFKWVTCPLLLERFHRDCARASIQSGILENIQVAQGRYLGKNTRDDPLGLEEREFGRDGDIPDDLITALAQAGIANQDALKQRLVILADRDFAWFARYALPVMARNRLDENKRVVHGALWYEEALPPETIMHVLLSERSQGAVRKLVDALREAPYIQMGGNETIGQGWFHMHVSGDTDDGKEEKT